MSAGTTSKENLAACNDQAPGTTNPTIIKQRFADGNAGICPAEKARATLAAQLAIAGGYALLELADGSFIVTRFDLTRHCVDLQSAAKFGRELIRRAK